MMLDARTALVMGAGFMAITSISLALLTRTLPEDIRRSALYGVAATGALTLSWLLFALESAAPEALTMVGANVMYAVALTLVYQSVRVFDGDTSALYKHLEDALETGFAIANETIRQQEENDG